MKNRYIIITIDNVIYSDDLFEIDGLLCLIDRAKKEFTFDFNKWYKIEVWRR